MANRPRFRPCRKPTDALSYFRQAQAKCDPDRGHLYLNKPAARIIERAIAHLAPETPVPRLGGVTLGAHESAVVATNLRALLNDEDDPEVKAAIQRIRDQFSRAQKSKPIVTVVNADSTVPVREVRETEKEEECHRALIEATGGNFSTPFVLQLIERPEVALSVHRLRKMRPDIATPVS